MRPSKASAARIMTRRAWASWRVARDTTQLARTRYLQGAYEEVRRAGQREGYLHAHARARAHMSMCTYRDAAVMSVLS